MVHVTAQLPQHFEKPQLYRYSAISMDFNLELESTSFTVRSEESQVDSHYINLIFEHSVGSYASSDLKPFLEIST